MKVTANQNIQYNQTQFSGNKKDKRAQSSVNPSVEYYTQFLKTTSASAALGAASGVGIYFANKKYNFSNIPKLGLKVGTAVGAVSALLLAPIAKYWAQREIYDKKMDDKYDEVVLDFFKNIPGENEAHLKDR
jgi:hypothetical protein